MEPLLRKSAVGLEEAQLPPRPDFPACARIDWKLQMGVGTVAWLPALQKIPGYLVSFAFEREWQVSSSRDGIGFENRRCSHDRGTKRRNDQRRNKNLGWTARIRPVRHTRAAAMCG